MALHNAKQRMLLSFKDLRALGISFSREQPGRQEAIGLALGQHRCTLA